MQSRTEPAPPADRLPIDRLDHWPLEWSLTEEAWEAGTPDWLKRLRTLRPKTFEFDPAAEKWIDDGRVAGRDPGYALEAVAWAEALPRLVTRLSGHVWATLVGHLVGLAEEAAELNPEEAPLVQSLLAGELALVLADQFPEWAGATELKRQAAKTLSTVMAEALDGEGLPHAEQLVHLRPLLGCWTRCRIIGSGGKRDLFSSDSAGQFEWAVRQALRWTRPDGLQALCDERDGLETEQLFRAALALDNDEDDHDLAVLVLPGSDKKEVDRLSKYAMPEAAAESEWSAASVLRPDWPWTGSSLWLTYPHDVVRSELAVGRDTLWSGVWDFEVRRDGKVLKPVTEWETVAWHSDEDIDFLELEIELEDDIILQRHAVMARDDDFLLMGDLVLGDDPARISYCGSVPLNTGIHFSANEESREGFLTAGARRRSALVLPLGLTEWQGQQDKRGTLQEQDGRLYWTQTTDQGSLYAPVFFDFNKDRFKRRLTWRHLTVCEALEVQPESVAAGFRVRIGESQWLIYRSLARAANRTVLGHNLSTEMIVGRFDVSGEVEKLLEVE